MNKFHKRPKLTQEEKENLNSPVSITEMELLIANLPIKNIQAQVVSLENSTKNLKKKITPMVSKLFWKIEEEETFLSFFYEAGVTQTPKPGKD